MQTTIRREPAGPTDKPPILFVHGAWHGAWCWEAYFLDWFADRGYPTVALDLRGHGSGSTRGASIGHYVRDVADVARSLPSPPVVVGHSMGGLVVQKYLEGHGAPAGVLLAPSPTSGAWMTTARVARFDPVSFAKVNLQLRLGPLIENRETARGLLFRDDDDRPEVEGWLDALCDESYLAYMGMLFDLPRPYRCSAPMLVVAGEDDRIFSVAQEEATARAHDADLIVIPGGSHDLMLDPDWETVAQSITDFLDRTL